LGNFLTNSELRVNNDVSDGAGDYVGVSDDASNDVGDYVGANDVVSDG
jgi:hypothetical protein